MKKIAAKTKRLLAYAGIIGACALLALTFFTISQYEKAMTFDKNAIENEDSKYHNAAVYWKANLDDFTRITNTNSAAYKGTAIPAVLTV